MNREQIEHITSNFYNKLKKNQKKIIASFEAETIHQFRVTYKKLRAFLRMLSLEDDAASGIKISGKLKKAYRFLGSMRDMYLQQQRIQEIAKQDLNKPRSYLDLLEKEIEKLRLQLAEIFSKKSVTKYKRKTGASMPGEFTLPGFKVFMKNKFNAVIKFTSGRLSDTTIHTIRKYLKDLFYNLKVFRADEHEKLSLLVWLGKDEKYYTTLLDELGNFQDKCTAIALLKPGWLRTLNKPEQQQLEGIKKQWTQEKKDTKKVLVHKLRADFVNQEDAIQAG